MTRPLSNDLRKRVVAAVAGGESCRLVASRFGVAVSSVVKWSQRYRATGSVAPGKMGGHRKRVLEPHRTFIMERIKQTPHLTLHRLKGVRELQPPAQPAPQDPVFSNQILIPQQQLRGPPSR
jgi:putative transposase